VCVIVTPDGAKFADLAGLAELTGHPVRSQYKQPDDPDVLPPPDAFVVAPATFNTINKWANGISGTLALGLLNEALGGLRVPGINALTDGKNASLVSVSCASLGNCARRSVPM
jgi:hypothetical protein